MLRVVQSGLDVCLWLPVGDWPTANLLLSRNVLIMTVELQPMKGANILDVAIC